MLSSNVTLHRRYRIIRRLGEGGMGAVYEALNEPVCSIVALKETFAQTEFERQAFIREAKLLANLDHEAFPKVIDHFFENDGQYLVMEFVRGNDFSELLSLRERPFEIEKVLEWAEQLLDALEELHDYPIIHRDIKPSNLKLTRRGKIKLLDFSIAKGTLERMTKPKTDGSLGAFTLQYAPIEQTLRASPHWVNVLNIINPDEAKKALSNCTDPRSDIYSLGATLYHLLTNQTPIDAPTRAVALWSGKLDPLISAEKLNSQISPALAGVLSQTMSLNRDDRPSNATQLRGLLREAVNYPDVVPSALAYWIQSAPLLTEISDEPVSTKQQLIEEDTILGKSLQKLTECQQSDFTSDLAAGEQINSQSNLESHPPVIESYPLTKNRSGRGRFLMGAAATILALVISLSAWQAADFGNPQTVQGSVNDEATTALPPVAGSVADDARPQSQNVAIEKSFIRSTPRKMTLVSAESFIMGQAENGDVAERPAHKVAVKPFYIDIYEVTNEDYDAYLKATGRARFNSNSRTTFDVGSAKLPVTGVAWAEANEYCDHYGKRLPAEEEWELAARGTDKRLYPWGNEWKNGMANADGAGGGLAEVGKSKGVSPFGVHDMAGNAWEWTASVMKPYPGGKMPSNQPTGKLRVIRGGTYNSSKQYATTTYRTGWPESGAATYDQTGFRCVQDVKD